MTTTRGRAGAGAAERPKAGRTGPKAPKTATDKATAFGGYGSELEAILASRIALAGLPRPEVQFRFCPTRKWRADFAYPQAMLLIEAQGGIWSGGRHARGSGVAAEAEKFSTAAALGYRVLPLTREMIESGQAVELIRQALAPVAGAGEDA